MDAESRLREAAAAIIAAADKRQGGDTPMQEIPKDLIIDLRMALAETKAAAK